VSTTISIAEHAQATSVWPQRLRLALIVAAVCATLTWLSGYSVLSRGLGRPLVLIMQLGSFTSLAAGGIILGGAILAAVTSRGDRQRDALLVIGWSLAIWASSGATVDQWLELRQPLPGSPTGAPYLSLLPDYAFLAILTIAASLFASGRAKSAPIPAAPQLIEGLKASLMTIAVAIVILYFANGPRTDVTRRGQVYFAIALAFYVAIALARNTTKVHSAIWYWPCPLIVGVIGLLYAALRPGLPFPYDQINNIPAWGPARALPVEMVGVGLLASLWGLKTTAPPATEPSK
jgi:hypothetical protein